MQNFGIEEFKNKKVSLVLSGGVSKASAWHTGVGLALEEIGFTLKDNTSAPSPYEISSYVGSSAGALLSFFFASGIKPSDITKSFFDPKNSSFKSIGYKEMLYLKKEKVRPSKQQLYGPFDTFPFFMKKLLSPFLSFTGLFSTEGLYKYLVDLNPDITNFEDLKADLFVVATQLDHSRKVIFSKYKYPSPIHDRTAVYYQNTCIKKAIAASMSVPPFYSPYPIQNTNTDEINYYIDGEIRDTLSSHVAIDNKSELIINSWTHTPYHYHDEVGSLVNYGIPAIGVQAIYLMIQKKIITSRANRLVSKDIINTIHDYMKSNKMDEKHRKKILGIIERKLSYNSNVKFIDICPKHTNYQMFLMNSFSLNKNNLSKIVNMGYKRTMEVFSNHQW